MNRSGQNLAEKSQEKYKKLALDGKKYYIVTYISMARQNLLILETSRPCEHKRNHRRNNLLLLASTPVKQGAASFEKQPSFLISFTIVHRCIQKNKR